MLYSGLSASVTDNKPWCYLRVPSYQCLSTASLSRHCFLLHYHHSSLKMPLNSSFFSISFLLLKGHIPSVFKASEQRSSFLWRPWISHCAAPMGKKVQQLVAGCAGGLSAGGAEHWAAGGDGITSSELKYIWALAYWPVAFGFWIYLRLL